MAKTPAKQPFLSITIFALLLMAALLYMQTRSDNSIRDLQKGNALSSVTFRANDSLAEIIQDINVIETAIRKDIIAGKLKENQGIQDTVNLMTAQVNNISALTKSISNKKYLQQLAEYVNEKKNLYKKIYGEQTDVNAAKNLLVSDSNKILNENIYVAAQSIQLQLENDLQSAIEKNTVVSAKVLWQSRILTILALAAILVLATVIIRHLFKNVQLIKDLEAEKHKTQVAANIKEQFLANMSHELRTPVNAIAGFTSLLQKSQLKPEQKEFVTIIKTASNNLHNIVNDILDISKIEAGMAQLRKNAFDVYDLLYEIEMLFTHAAMEKKLEIIYNIGGQVPRKIKGDSEKLKQILTNLIANAIKFTREGNIYINVSSTLINDSTVTFSFSVKDNGIGIPQDKQQSIFDRFEQADAQTTRNYGGTGLGLAIVKKLVSMQAGNIVLHSKENEGAEFIISIPYDVQQEDEYVAHEALSDKADKLQKRIFSSKTRVLAAEDNRMNQLLLTYIFNQWKITPTIAGNGLQALELIEANSYDLILMDIQMPAMDGYTAVKHLRKTMRVNTPVIAMTAHAMPGEKEKCIAAGMDDYLPKPIIEDELVSLMTKHLPPHLILLETASATYIDIEELKNTFGYNDLFVKNILSQFLSQFPEEILELQQAYDQHNFKKLNAVAHSLKTTVTSVNTLSLFIPALEILEDAVFQENEHAVFAAVAQLTSATEDVKTQTRELLSAL